MDDSTKDNMKTKTVSTDQLNATKSLRAEDYVDTPNIELKPEEKHELLVALDELGRAVDRTYIHAADSCYGMVLTNLHNIASAVEELVNELEKKAQKTE